MSKKENIDIKVKPTVDGSEVEELDYVLKSMDGTEIVFKAKPIVEDGASDELDNIQKKADDLDGASPKIKPTVDDSEALSSLENLQKSVDNLGGLEAGLAAAIGGLGIEQLLGGGIETATNMDKSWRNWVGSLQEAGLGLDEAKGKADQFYETVNNLASAGQSTDSFFKSIAGLVISMDTAVSDSTLQMAEKVTAGYEMLGARSGATLYEMEKELKNFLSTGDLGKMEDTLSSLRDPEKWRIKLEGADTVEERLQVLQDMLQEEGIMGALNIDAPTKSIDQLRALFDAGMTKIGTTILAIVKPVADFFLWLDTVTGGASTSVMVVVGIILLLGLTFIGLVGMMLPAIASFGTFALAAINAVLPMLGMNATALTLGGGFMALASAVWAALAPLLPFIAAGLAVAAAIYLIGQYFGWWKDLPSMFEAIKAGVMRLWDAFVNNKHVQAVIAWLQAAWQGVMTFLQPIFDWIIAGWNSLFPPQEGGFDIVQQIINLFGWLGDGIAAVIAFVQANWPIVQMVLSPVLIPLRAIISVIQLIYSNWGRITSWFQVGANTIRGVINTLLAPFVSFASGVMSAYNTYIAPVINWIADGIGKLKEFLGLQGQAAGGAAGGGGLSAAGGLLMDKYQDISYPTSNTYNIYLNGLVTEQSMIDELLRLIRIGEEQEKMRV